MLSRSAPYLGIFVALLLGILFAFVSDDAPVSLTSTQPISNDSLTPDGQLIFVESTTTPPSLEQEKSIKDIRQAETVISTKETLTPVKALVAEASTKIAQVFAPVALSSSESASLDASATTLRSALVNIICFAPSGSGIRSISGSGVLIDPKGIILTNAHIAQYFLLAERNVSCKVRAGSPAVEKYEAALIYIPFPWVQANASVLTEANPSGTGEYDFAFLAITKSATSVALPSLFSFVPLATTPPHTGTPVVIGSYGAQFLESSQIQSFLFPTLVFGSVKDIFTFASTTIDVLALGGSVAAQEGSSGGGISDVNGELVGVITTSTTKGPTSTRSLGAITSSYIRSEYASETGEALDLLLAQPLSVAIADFAPHLPALELILTSQLP